MYESLDSAPAATGNVRIGKHAFRLTAYRNGNELSTITFQKPILLVIDYSDLDFAGFNDGLLDLYFYDDGTGEWSDDGLTVLSRDPVNNRIVVEITHFTQFALGVSEYFMFQPIAME